MPLKACINLKNLVKQEDQIILTISALKKQEIHNVCEAVYINNMPCTTLQQQLNRQSFQAKTHTNRHKIT
jgi:hypothetical protein